MSDPADPNDIPPAPKPRKPRKPRAKAAMTSAAVLPESSSEPAAPKPPRPRKPRAPKPPVEAVAETPEIVEEVAAAEPAPEPVLEAEPEVLPEEASPEAAETELPEAVEAIPEAALSPAEPVKTAKPPIWKRPAWLIGAAAAVVLAVVLVASLFWSLPLSRALEPLNNSAIVLVADDGSPIARRGSSGRVAQVGFWPADIRKIIFGCCWAQTRSKSSGIMPFSSTSTSVTRRPARAALRLIWE